MPWRPVKIPHLKLGLHLLSWSQRPESSSASSPSLPPSLMWNRSCGVCKRDNKHQCPSGTEGGVNSPVGQPESHRYACPKLCHLLPLPQRVFSFLLFLRTPHALSWTGRVAACQALACGQFGKSVRSGAEVLQTGKAPGSHDF